MHLSSGIGLQIVFGLGGFVGLLHSPGLIVLRSMSKRFVVVFLLSHCLGDYQKFCRFRFFSSVRYGFVHH